MFPGNDTAPFAAVAVFVFGSLYAWFSRKKKSMTDKKTKLSVQLSVPEYNIIKVWADKNGMTLSDYVRKTLVESIPDAEVQKANDAPATNDVIDRAFEELAQTDHIPLQSGGVFGFPPPARKPIPGLVTEAERTHPQQRVVKVTPMRLPTVPPGPHPCMHLSSHIPGHLRGQCQGTCMHRDQRGRICYWTPTTCSNCTLFETRAGHAAPKPNR